MALQVLVVDDDQALLQFMTHILEEEGHHVVTFDDGFAALTHLTASTPDVVFVDYVLPRMDGDDLGCIIRSMSHLQQTYLVLISAAASELEIDEEDSCFNACIAKGAFPVMAKHVLTAIEHAQRGAEDGAPLQVLGVDEVRPRRMTRELFARKRHLEVILESIAEGILEVEADQVVYANSVAVDLLSRRREEVLGQRLFDLFADEQRPRLEQMLFVDIDSPSGLARLRPLELHGRLVLVRKLPVPSSASSVVVITDVTEQKRLEEQFYQAQKLEALGTIAGGIAHNFNNLLQGVLGCSSLLLMSADPASRDHKLLAHIEQCGKRGAELTRQLLSFARGRKAGERTIAINELVEGALAVFENSRRETRVVRKLQADACAVEADPAQIEQVVLNLCINAWQAMGERGEITVATSNETLEPDFVVAHGVAAGRYVQITVRDTGVGIEERHRSKVFEPFFTTRGLGSGTGLGLSSSFGIVRNHGGIIDFESEVGQGSTFFVLLPASGEEGDASGRPVVQPPGGSEVVLLVDDEEHVVTICRRMLSALGYEVVTASTGEEALGVLAREGDRIQILLLDVVMPEMNGWKVAERVWQERADLPIVFTSGYSMSAPGGVDLKGRHGFLDKPFHVSSLASEVRRVLDEG